MNLITMRPRTRRRKLERVSAKLAAFLAPAFASETQARRVIDPVLTEQAVGYLNSPGIGLGLMPLVYVDKEGVKIPKFGKQSFMEFNTKRALRADSNRLTPEMRTTIDAVLTEHDIEEAIDYREIAEDLFPSEEVARRKVQDIIYLVLERQIASLAQDANNYGSGNKVALADTTCWSHTSSVPLTNIDTGKDAVRAAVGRRPNTIAFGAVAWKNFKNHAQVKGALPTNVKNLVTRDMAREILEIPNILIGEAVTATDAGVVSDVWGDNVVLAYVPGADAGAVEQNPEARSIYEPAFGYTLRKRGYPEVDTRDENGKLRIVRCTDLLEPKLVGMDAGYLIANTQA
jgi:hypothetical protein